LDKGWNSFAKYELSAYGDYLSLCSFSFDAVALYQLNLKLLQAEGYKLAESFFLTRRAGLKDVFLEIGRVYYEERVIARGWK